MKLQEFMKWQGMAETGGHAKVVIQGGEVLVNGAVETRRGYQMKPGDVVEFAGQKLTYQEP